MPKPTSVDHYITINPQWEEELKVLRDIALSLDLEETIKWMFPTYTWNNKNIIGLAAFKTYFGIWFFQGATLTDPNSLLTNAQEGKTAAMRQIRFHSIEEISPEIIKNYILEAIQNQKDGKIIKPSRKKAEQLNTPAILIHALKENHLLGNFEAYTIAKKNEFINHINKAKQEATKLRRIEKIIPLIKKGFSLNDKYRLK